MTNDEIKRIQRGLNALGGVLKVDGSLGPLTRGALMDFQRGRGLPVNGAPDEKTLAALWRAVPAEMPPAPSSDALRIAGERALEYAMALWRQDVYDPRASDESDNARRCKAIIGDLIVRVGWGWSLHDGRYLGNGPPQWCGLFAGDCWRAAGLDPHWLAVFWASTIRMAKWFRYDDWGAGQGQRAGTKPASGGRMIMRGTDAQFPDGTQPRAGDIVIVGDGTPVEGDHITLLVEKNGDDYVTLSGNGGGVGPTGKPREGISKQTYHVHRGGYRVLWVARPGVDDLIVAST